jgi:outer membrane protein insertion porin family
MALGVRGQVGYIRPFADTTEIPYYQRYFLGGETQIRGYGVRTVAPYDPRTQTSIGGNKFLLFNAETRRFTPRACGSSIQPSPLGLLRR